MRKVLRPIQITTPALATWYGPGNIITFANTLTPSNHKHDKSTIVGSEDGRLVRKLPDCL